MEIFYSIRLNILNLFFVMDPILESIVNVISTLMKNSTEFFIMMLRLLKELLLLPVELQLILENLQQLNI